MKTSTLKQFLAVSVFLLCQNTFGQLAAIDSLKLIPENPNVSDEIKLICYSTFAYGGCDLQNHSVTFQGNQITVNLEYEPGFLAYICHSVDTISLGNLNTGNYQLYANLIILPMDETADTDTLSFSVDSPLNIGENPSAGSLIVYPNPFYQEFQIKTDAMIETVEIHSVSGQKITLKESTVSPNKTIHLPDLENGVYLLIATDSKGNKYTKRIIKNTL